MSEETWKSWVARYAAFYGLTHQSQLTMLGMWADYFAEAGYYPSELWEAARQVAKQPPKFPADHFAALQEAAKAIRAVAMTLPPPPEPDRVCGLCGGCGVVSVPNRKNAHLPTWTSAGVLCRCGLGKWMLEQERRLAHKRPVSLTIDEYEQEVPLWRDLVEQRRREQLAWAAAQRATREAGQIGGAIDAVLKRAKGG